MERIITKHELWNLPNEQITELTKRRTVRILMNNGGNKEILDRIFCSLLTLLIFILVLEE